VKAKNGCQFLPRWLLHFPMESFQHFPKRSITPNAGNAPPTNASLLCHGHRAMHPGTYCKVY
jgi:hypothetical protein